MAATSQLTTSTPFHPGANMSLVMLDHLTQNTSVSPLVNPDTSLCAVNLDVSTISPALYTSVVNTAKEQRKNLTKISVLPDWSHESVAPSHTRSEIVTSRFFVKNISRTGRLYPYPSSTTSRPTVTASSRSPTCGSEVVKCRQNTGTLWSQPPRSLLSSWIKEHKA